LRDLLSSIEVARDMERTAKHKTARQIWQVTLSGTLIGLIAPLGRRDGRPSGSRYRLLDPGNGGDFPLGLPEWPSLLRHTCQSHWRLCVSLSVFRGNQFPHRHPGSVIGWIHSPIDRLFGRFLSPPGGYHTARRWQELSQERLLQVLAWLVPVFGVGALTFFVPRIESSQALVSGALLAACAAIALIVFGVSRDIALFLRETGWLFDEFFYRAAGLLVPAFAFLSFYSLLVILFAALYAVLDQATGGANFRIDGIARAITFPESLYFSVMTLSTVGYGDIAPATSGIRVIAAAEIVSGILLLLFGFNEIFSFARRRRD
jgi:voltage-gated potassium channel Kch